MPKNLTSTIKTIKLEISVSINDLEINTLEVEINPMFIPKVKIPRIIQKIIEKKLVDIIL